MTDVSGATSGSAASGRAHLAYDHRGTGRPAVFLHAGVTDRRSWVDTIDRLRGVDALAYDRRGFGSTTYEAEPHSRVSDLLAVMDAVGFDRAVLVGSSQGGAVAVEAALDAPDRVEALLLIGPGVSGLADPETVPAEVVSLVNAIEAAEAVGDVDEVNRLEAHLWLDGPTAREGRVGGEARRSFLEMNGQALAAASVGAHRSGAPANDRLGELATPVMVLLGRLDEVLMGPAARRLEAAASADLRLIDGVAHLPQLERPGLVAEAVHELISRLPPRSSGRSRR